MHGLTDRHPVRCEIQENTYAVFTFTKRRQPHDHAASCGSLGAINPPRHDIQTRMQM